MLQRKFSREHESPNTPQDAPLGDLRFRSLLSKDEWAALPAPVRARFSKRVAGGETVVYAGQVSDTQLSPLGWLFAQGARLCGSPLPLGNDTNVPAVVSVTEDGRSGGQIWTRLYGRRRGFPQIIHSAKQFAGPTGLEEHVGGGIGMALTVHEEEGALVFRSAFYFWDVFGLRLMLPLWLTPGRLAVTHREEEGGEFSFVLEIVHPFFGPIIRQTAYFRDVKP